MVRRNLLTVWLLFISLAPLKLAAQDAYFPSEMQDIVHAIVRHSVMQEYDTATGLALQLKRRYPDHPAGYFFQAAVLQSKMMDYENYARLEEFFRLTKRAVALAQKDIKRYPRNSWPYFFLGASLGYKAFYFFRDKNYLQAFRDGWNAIKMLELALERDSTNYDIYLGVGAFKYYKSKYGKYVKILPFVADERDLGIRMIQKAIYRGRFAAPAAMNALIWIYIAEERYEDAGDLVRQALNAYPRSRFFLWGKAALAYKQKQWIIARNAYRELLATYESEGDTASPFNQMVCHVMLADIYQRMKAPQQANRHASLALQFDIDKPLKKRAKIYYEVAHRILEETRTGGD